MTDYQKDYDRLKVLVEDYLNGLFTEKVSHGVLYESMRYSLLAGGKRIRPVMALKFAESVGGSAEKVLPAACALEMVHTYSLIHDDLPCMDNDELRRGKPTNHVVYGECLATLAGDALQAAAFETLLTTELPAETVVRAARALGQAAGEDGICGGQVLDTLDENEAKDITLLTEIHEMKTAAMIIAAARIGVICGGGTDSQLEAAEKYAKGVGIAFQIRDDILDVTSTTEKLGKPVGSDAECGKSTFATLLGIDKCEEIIDRETELAVNAIENAIDDGGFFRWLAELLAKRTY